MKKFATLLIIIALAISLIATPVFAAPGNGKGAVKVDLAGDPYNTQTPVVGSVILNTTGNGELIVLVNVDEVPNLVDWDVRVFIRDENNANPSSETFVDVLDTNAQGQGNVQVRRVIPQNVLFGDLIKVEVNIAPSFPPFVYGIGQVDVPLK